MGKKRYIYLGQRVRDRSPRGLSHTSEIRDIANQVARDAKSGKISRKKANARLLALWFAAKRRFGGAKRRRALGFINAARKRLGFKPIRSRGRRGGRRG